MTLACVPIILPILCSFHKPPPFRRFSPCPLLPENQPEKKKYLLYVNQA